MFAEHRHARESSHTCVCVCARAHVCVCMSMPMCLCAMSAGDVGGWKGAWVPWSCGYKLLEEGMGNLVPLKEQPVL